MLEIGANEQLQRIVTRDYETFSGGLLEKYFRTKAMESKNFTNIGNYWDRKGLIEIDYIALNEIDKTIDIAEVKRNKKKIDLVKLQEKVTILSMEIKLLTLYEISLVSLSLEDM